MNIGLVDIDGHNFPNLALMKISAYHKSIGDNVSWVDIGNYDRTYMSKVFTFSPDYSKGLANYGEVIKGGTGFKMTNTLPSEIDKLCPDYSIYPKFTAAYGFLLVLHDLFSLTSVRYNDSPLHCISGSVLSPYVSVEPRKHRPNTKTDRFHPAGR